MFNVGLEKRGRSGDWEFVAKATTEADGVSVTAHGIVRKAYDPTIGGARLRAEWEWLTISHLGEEDRKALAGWSSRGRGGVAIIDRCDDAAVPRHVVDATNRIKCRLAAEIAKSEPIDDDGMMIAAGMGFDLSNPVSRLRCLAGIA